jgi:hypothetical protein
VWLSVLGRCCLQWAAALLRLQRQGATLAGSYSHVLQQVQQEALDTVSGQAKTADSIGFWFFEGRDVEPILYRQLAVLEEMSRSLAARNGRVCERLLLGGYGLKPIAQSISPLVLSYYTVLQVCCTCGPNTVVNRLSSLIGALVSLGEGLSVFAVRHCCNNPRCVNTCGLSEKFIVCGSSCLCAGCKVARYCGKACQEACWTQGAHKPVCKMLRTRSAGLKA